MTQLIWLRYEDAEEDSEVRESLQKLINLAGMHGFKFDAVELDNVIQESMATEFLEVQSGELELSDADLDLMAAGKFWGGSKRRPKKKPDWDKCQKKKIRIHGTYVRIPDCV